MIQNVLKRCFRLIMGAITTCIIYVLATAVRIAVMEVENERNNRKKE